MSFKYLAELQTEQCSVKIISYSESVHGDRLVSWELEYPRYILAEINTHGTLERNSMSSRAVPVQSMLNQVRGNPAMPVQFGKNKSGMVDDGEFFGLVGDGYTMEAWWKLAAFSAAAFASQASDAGYHKQVCNRLVEPFQRMKTVLSATDLEGFFTLRTAHDADPTFQELAKLMKQSLTLVTPEKLEGKNLWHLPYIVKNINEKGYVDYFTSDGVKVTIQQALAISASCVAQVSYRNINTDYSKASDVYTKLGVGTEHFHASPFTHQAKAMKQNKLKVYEGFNPDSWEEGITHVDRKGDLRSGRFKGFIQHRHLL